jgi:hypothetical protein
MGPLLLAVLLAAEAPAVEATAPPKEPERLVAPEVAAGLGILGASYSQPGYRLGDAHLTPVVTARYLLGGFTTDAGVLLVAPLTGDGMALAFTGSLRIGWTWRKWSAVGGITMQWASGATPSLQWLPSLRVSGDFGPFGMTLGVLDQLALVPAHLAFDFKVERRKFSVGWVAPIGLIAGADLPITERFGLRITAFAFKAFQAEVAMLTIAGTFGGGR